MKTLQEILAERPADRERVDAHKARMLAEVRAYRLRELRENAGLTQVDLAERIGVGQRQVSKIEHGDLDSAKLGTIRAYLEAVGGDLAIEFVAGDQRIRIGGARGSNSRARTPRKPRPRVAKSAVTGKITEKAVPKKTATKKAAARTASNTPKAMTDHGR